MTTRAITLFILQSDLSLSLSLSLYLPRAHSSLYLTWMFICFYMQQRKRKSFFNFTPRPLVSDYSFYYIWNCTFEESHYHDLYLDRECPVLLNSKLSRHDNKTLLAKCCFSTLICLYLLKVTSAPVKWPVAVALLLQSEYFHDSFNLDKWIRSEFCSTRVLRAVIMWQMYRCRSRLYIQGRLHNQNTQVYR